MFRTLIPASRNIQSCELEHTPITSLGLFKTRAEVLAHGTCSHHTHYSYTASAVRLLEMGCQQLLLPNLFCLLCSMHYLQSLCLCVTHGRKIAGRQASALLAVLSCMYFAPKSAPVLL